MNQTLKKFLFILFIFLFISFLLNLDFDSKSSSIKNESIKNYASIDLRAEDNRIFFSNEKQEFSYNGINIINKKASTNIGDYFPPRFYKNSTLEISYSKDFNKIIINTSSFDKFTLSDFIIDNGFVMKSGDAFIIYLYEPSKNIIFNLPSKFIVDKITIDCNSYKQIIEERLYYDNLEFNYAEGDIINYLYFDESYDLSFIGEAYSKELNGLDYYTVINLTVADNLSNFYYEIGLLIDEFCYSFILVQVDKLEGERILLDTLYSFKNDLLTSYNSNSSYAYITFEYLILKLDFGFEEIKLSESSVFSQNCTKKLKN